MNIIWRNVGSSGLPCVCLQFSSELSVKRNYNYRDHTIPQNLHVYEFCCIYRSFVTSVFSPSSILVTANFTQNTVQNFWYIRYIHSKLHIPWRNSKRRGTPVDNHWRMDLLLSPTPEHGRIYKGYVFCSFTVKRNKSNTTVWITDVWKCYPLGAEMGNSDTSAYQINCWLNTVKTYRTCGDKTPLLIIFDNKSTKDIIFTRMPLGSSSIGQERPPSDKSATTSVHQSGRKDNRMEERLQTRHNNLDDIRKQLVINETRYFANRFVTLTVGHTLLPTYSWHVLLLICNNLCCHKALYWQRRGVSVFSTYKADRR